MSKLNLVPAAEQESTSPLRLSPGASAILAIDVSRSKWVYCLRSEGREWRMTTPGTLDHLKGVVRRYEHCQLHVVYEACGFGYEIAWYLKERSIDVMVIAPCTVERAPGRQVKTDRLDAAKMAFKREQGQLKGVYVPSRHAHERRQLARTYVQARKDRRREQTRIRALLQEHGMLGPPPRQGWNAYVAWMRQQTMPPPVEQCVGSLLQLRHHADQCVTRLKSEMLACANDPQDAPIVAAISEQPGIGPFSAIWLKLELIDIKRFTGGKALVRYLGLAPSEYSSGEMVRRGHILKCGPGVLRALLVECAWRSVRAVHGDPELHSFYQRLRSKGLQPKQAIVAVTRKLALRLHQRWSASIAAKSDEAAA